MINTTLSPQFTWDDRRPIAAIHVADGSPSHYSATNPATWLFNPAIDIGTKDFLVSMKDWANESIKVMKDINAQGMICWEIDGGRYPDQMYLGCPDLATTINPELVGVVDKFFSMFRLAGFKVGVCLRPEEFNLETKKLEHSRDPYATLLRKATYAHQTWQCKLFYVDSNVRPEVPTSAPNAWQWGPLLPATLFARLHKALPDCLFIPEHEDENYYLYTAPYLEARGGEFETPANIREAIPDAFSVINISGSNVEDTPKLLDANKRGDILLLNGWWYDENVKALIEARGI